MHNMLFLTLRRLFWRDNQCLLVWTWPNFHVSILSGDRVHTVCQKNWEDIWETERHFAWPGSFRENSIVLQVLEKFGNVVVMINK